MSFPRNLIFVAVWVASITTVVSPYITLAQDLKRPPREPVDVAESTQGVVVSDTKAASEIGSSLLAKGGNAVDAAIGVAFALEVTWPEAGNIGGGGFMLVAPPDEEVMCINYREKAPANVDPHSFSEWTQHRHIRMAGVPGTVRGMALAHEKYGKLPWAEIIAPSIALARDGIEVDAYLAYSLNSVLTLGYIQSEPRFAEFRRVYGKPDGSLWKAGDRLVQPDLAKSLSLIAEQGSQVFYEGEIAQQIAKESEAGGGLMALKDLKQYTAQVRPAMHAKIGDYTLYGAPLPSSGGTVVLMQMQMLQALDFPKDTQQYWTTKQVHLMTEVMRRAFRERAAWLGDSDFVSVPDHLQSKAFAEKLAATIDPNQATPSEAIAGSIALSEGPAESMETTHFSVIDKDGMAVSNTYTLEGTFGCRIVVKGTGILLNNEMGDFNWYPGTTNRDGDIGTLPNQLAPGKRMLSSQSPMIVREDGQVKLIVGSPGGRTIINTVTEILVQTLMLGRSLEDAIDGPRFHHQWFPDTIRFETVDEGVFDNIRPELKAMGHDAEDRTVWRQGSAHGIVVNLDTGEAKGVADWRRGGAARAPVSVTSP
ncbi:gamma-glutamyltransferase [Bremerella cremea]|uniref:gamma-glutamyltransferase n=1 Tax=Bremerella cremea TaxID=1031537 RepID=UPI0031ED9734